MDPAQPKRLNALNQFALRHPLGLAVASFVVLGLFVWQVSGLEAHEALIVGGIGGVLNGLLWLPKVGPARRYTERLIREGKYE